MMPGVKYVIYDCSSARTTPGVSLYQSLKLKENIILVTHDGTTDGNLKRQIKSRTLCTCKLLLLT